MTFSTHVLQVPVDVVESYPCTACAQVTAVSGAFGEHLHGVSAMDERAQGANLCDIICPDVSENRHVDLQVANLRQLQVPKDKGEVSVLCPTVFPSPKEATSVSGTGLLDTCTLTSAELAALKDQATTTDKFRHDVPVAGIGIMRSILAARKCGQKSKLFTASKALALHQAGEDLSGSGQHKWWEVAYHPELISASIAEKVQSCKYCQSLSLLDLFSGTGGMTLEFRSHGLETVSFDIASLKRNDITTQEGFLNSVAMLVRVNERGTVVAGPPCLLMDIFVFKLSQQKTGDGVGG